MQRIIKLLFMMFLTLGVFIACSDNSTGVDDNNNGESENSSSESTTGVVVAQVATSGSDKDSDGYKLILKNVEEKDVAIDETAYFNNVEEGSHEMELIGTADNCNVEDTNPQSFDVTAEDTTSVSFSVTCTSQGPAALFNKIAYESSGQNGGYSKLYLMNDDGSNPEMLHELDSKNVLQPDISPDGKTIVFSAGSFDNYIFAMDSDGSNLRQLTNDENDADDYDPAWSPDGSKIAFERGGEIYVMNADGSGQTNVTNTPNYVEEDPTWSPNGQQIAYARAEDDSYTQDEGNIYIMNADGTQPEPITQTATDIDRNPVWSPDGTKIAFSRRSDGDVPEIFVMDQDGGNISQVTQMPSGASDYSSREPVWSPDGNKIAFTGRREGNTYIHLINPDGTQETALDNGTINHGSASWSPMQ